MESMVYSGVIIIRILPIYWGNDWGGRDTSAAVGYAIGALALDDNTIGGESRFTSETGPSGYIAHTPDPVNHPLPLTLHEGQQFTMGRRRNQRCGFL